MVLSSSAQPRAPLAPSNHQATGTNTACWHEVPQSAYPNRSTPTCPVPQYRTVPRRSAQQRSCRATYEPEQRQRQPAPNGSARRGISARLLGSLEGIERWRRTGPGHCAARRCFDWQPTARPPLRRSEIPGEFIYLIRPRSFLIVGNLNEFIGEAGGIHHGKYQSFQLYRRNMQEPEIITFDELLARAEGLVNAADA
jgi:hypothetical protein